MNYTEECYQCSITAEEARKIDEEYEIADIYNSIKKSMIYLSPNTTLSEALVLLKPKSRFIKKYNNNVDSF
jgi:hypothetical protein